MVEIFTEYLEYIIIGTIFFVMLILIISLFIKLNKMKNRIEKFMVSNDEFSIEKMITEYLAKVEKVENQNIDIENKLKELNDKMKLAITKVNLIRYNPFEDTGGDLCYALVLLDENNNGVILNSIYSREGSYNYAKPIIDGKSEKHKLSDEEQAVLEQAISK